MNDLDLNKEIAEKLGIDTNPLGRHAATSTVSVAYSIPNYCTNWQDGGPIIEEYKIALQPYYKNHMKGNEELVSWRANNQWNATEETGSYYEDKSPLKAAMLCFLEMEI